MFFFCKQKTAYDMRISDWSSDVCSSDLGFGTKRAAELARAEIGHAGEFFDRQFGSKIAPRIAKRRLDPVTLGIEFEQRRMLGLAAGPAMMQIGSASCRERVCQYV